VTPSQHVARRPERYAMPKEKATIAAVEAELESVLASELLSRRFPYTRSDDPAWTLVLKDVGDFEMAYHLDDGVEPVGRAS